jgi:hypothetical protein
MDKSEIHMLQRDQNSLGEWGIENKMKVNPVKVKQ